MTYKQTPLLPNEFYQFEQASRYQETCIIFSLTGGYRTDITLYTIGEFNVFTERI